MTSAEASFLHLSLNIEIIVSTKPIFSSHSPGFVFSLTMVAQFLKVCGGTPQGLPFSEFAKLHAFLTTGQSTFAEFAAGATTLTKEQLRAAVDKSGMLKCIMMASFSIEKNQ